MMKHVEFIWMPCEKIYMMAVLKFKWQETNAVPQLRDPDRTDFEIGHMVLIMNHTTKDVFDSKYKYSLQICKKILDKAFDVQDSAGKVRQVSVQQLQVLYHMHCCITKS